MPSNMDDGIRPRPLPCFVPSHHAYYGNVENPH